MAEMTPQGIGILFPGQGAQYVGMGRALYEQSAAAARVLDEAESALEGAFLTALFEGPEEALTATDVSQPAIYAVSYAAYCVLRESCPELKVSAVAGLSLGEYTALTAAGSLPFSEGVRLVRHRGRLMQAAAEERRGTMASVLGLEADLLAGICDGIDDVYVANYNCPGQIVISGSETGVQQASAACNEAGARRVVPLQVSGAFHSPFMASAREQLQPVLDAVPWVEPQFPVLANVTGMPYESAGAIAPLLGRQVVESVRWEDDCRWILLQGVERFCEVGPGKVLQGLMRKIERGARVVSMETPEEIAAARDAMQ
jgi:[acyl-carrier-protein] S-malonyltransferase